LIRKFIDESILNDASLANGNKISLVTFDEFEKLVVNNLFVNPLCISIQPVLQVWGNLGDGRNYLSGFLIVNGIESNYFVIAGYSVDSIETFDLEYEKQKFAEMVDELFTKSFVENGLVKMVVINKTAIQ